MSATRLNAIIVQNTLLLLISVCVAVILGAISIKINNAAIKRNNNKRKNFSAFVVTLASAGVCYFAIHEVHFIPQDTNRVNFLLDPSAENTIIWSIIFLSLLLAIMIPYILQYRLLVKTVLEGSVRLDSMMDTSVDALIQMNDKGDIVGWSYRAQQVFGWSKNEAIGRELAKLIIPPRFREAHNKGLQHFLATREGPILNRVVEVEGLHQEGYCFPMELTISFVQLASWVEFNALVRDISERIEIKRKLIIANEKLAKQNDLMKEQKIQLEQIAHYDMLTNLPNRTLLANRISKAIDQRTSLVVAFLDLDDFKQINDRYGHHLGDELLITLSKRMKDSLRQGDTLARIGGDEFIAVMVDLGDINESRPFLDRLIKAASQPVNVDRFTLSVSASIGVSIYPQDGVDADQLIRHSGQAMYAAKQEGKNHYRLFDNDLASAAKIKAQNIDEIRLSLDEGEFVLYYQPKVNMLTGEVIGVEALIRWQHSVRGLVSPFDFLPTIENHALSIDLGEWVINEALTQISQWQNIGILMSISVNISAYQLQQDNFKVRLEKILVSHPDILPCKLELEILETSSFNDIHKVSAIIQNCRQLGVNFALDDFGTGYSSLTYLRWLPTNTIKIDQTFIRDMLINTNDLAIVKGVISLTKAFHREVVAEGVETIEHGTLLLQLGCTLAQGYIIAKPMPAADFSAWLGNWNSYGAWRDIDLKMLDYSRNTNLSHSI
jgi:diguanylate cyclase (GGDEF)-like protein/PAS domain S-box-containing protein